MSTQYDVIVIGAGPAGMAAATTAARHKARVLLLDEQRAPGGQLYRAIESTQREARSELGDAYFAGASLVQAFRDSPIDYISNASVWQVSPEREVGFSVEGRAKLVSAGEIILATGAQERPFPVQGWTLNGVMTVGAAQILLKESALGVHNAVFAGTGPLLYLAVHQYLQAGIAVAAVLDMTAKRNYRKALPYMPAALSQAARLFEGWRWKRQAASSVPMLDNIEEIKIVGEDKVTGVEYRRNGHWQLLETGHVLLHQGVIPDINLSLAAGCDRQWNTLQCCWNVKVDDWYQSSIESICVAGDGASIAGGTAARHSGEIAALGALLRLGKISQDSRDREALAARSALTAELRIRPFLETLFRPAETSRIPQQDEILVCRCEEVSVAEIREAYNVGCDGPNQLKSFSRCGMGPCQGRMCGTTISELIAHWSNREPDDVGYFRIRPPVKPLLLQELACLNDNGTSE